MNRITGALLIEFGALARRYCELIEAHQTFSEREFLLEMDALLPTLYSAASKLNRVSPQADESDLEPQDEGPDVEPPPPSDPTQLERFLANSDRYRKILSPYPASDDDENVIEGCLSWELTFIYDSLRLTLPAIDTEPSDASIKKWREFVRLRGDAIVEALTAINYALYQEDLFEDDDS